MLGVDPTAAWMAAIKQRHRCSEDEGNPYTKSEWLGNVVVRRLA
jgi:hypothetical protein